MRGRYSDLIERLVHVLVRTAGETDSTVREAALRGVAVPDSIQPYLDKVRSHAYRITDADVRTLREAGWSEDAIFELTLSAALGSALLRLDRGMAALRGDTR